MNLPVEAITEFQEIYQRKLGVVISTDEASIKAENLLRLIVLLSGQPKIKDKNISLNLYEK